MAKGIKVAFGGETHTGSSLTAPAVEIWSCSFAMLAENAYVLDTVQIQAIGDKVRDWFVSPSAGIADTESLQYVKPNEFDLITGKQITDPSNQVDYTGTRGAITSSQPITATYRISIDNGTRNPSARGGFFPPRTGIATLQSGRGDTGAVAAMANAAQLLFQEMQVLAGGMLTVGVYSKTDATIYSATRLRVGDVPDHISRRRNALREAYEVRPI